MSTRRTPEEKRLALRAEVKEIVVEALSELEDAGALKQAQDDNREYVPFTQNMVKPDIQDFASNLMNAKGGDILETPWGKLPVRIDKRGVRKENKFEVKVVDLNEHTRIAAGQKMVAVEMKLVNGAISEYLQVFKLIPRESGNGFFGMYGSERNRSYKAPKTQS